jgi:hypothetical protein
MSKHPWVSLAVAMLLGAAGCIVVGIVGCDAAKNAEAREREKAELASQKPVVQTRNNVFSKVIAVGNFEAKEDPEGFRFPDDRGGQILSKVLPPSEKGFPPAERDAPASRRHPPSGIDKLLIPLPPAPTDMPRLPAGKPAVLRPRPLPEDLSLAGHLGHPTPPEIQTLHAGDRVRIPSVDVNLPIPVPILAQPASSRAPFDDVTADASRTAALATAPPARTTPAPFLKIDLPDPFEYRLKPVVLPLDDVTLVHTGSRPSK